MYIIKDSVTYPREPQKVYISYFKEITALAVWFTTRTIEAKRFNTKKEALETIKRLKRINHRNKRKFEIIPAGSE